ncbi:chain-length determining protein [Salinisphaera sp.]|uniref:chain-length determining protein n=1 Tax=Salinisphaera sp. TaxID=1914330 RepID=UPI000C4AA587|nr:chain-length determining protein [Salinisphaera sp.]MBS62618.1 chain-length determining protein [Salinisphaera sp.]
MNQAPQTASRIHADVFAAHAPHSPKADTLRATLARIALGDAHARCLAVVGCGAHRDRSAVAANLAVLLARSGEPTALIDAARQRARQQELFGLADTGMADIAAVPGLTVMRATDTQPSLAETLVEAPGRFGQFVARLRQDYEFVVIDTADHPEDLDAISAAGVSDGALLVVERNVTPLHRLRQLTDGLRESGAALLGAVLTDR